ALTILSHNMKHIREQYAFSKRDMARLLGIGIGSLNKLEKGELPPRLGVEILFNIQHYFGISPQILLTEKL
ncbi:MAG: helix-turn-helix transcriptional regulator, partial [Clostridia bacterium]|nr:helix-turn-helix transcriptional regulator [Clostridia bacterium]